MWDTGFIYCWKREIKFSLWIMKALFRCKSFIGRKLRLSHNERSHQGLFLLRRQKGRQTFNCNCLSELCWSLSALGFLWGWDEERSAISGYKKNPFFFCLSPHRLTVTFSFNNHFSGNSKSKFFFVFKYGQSFRGCPLFEKNERREERERNRRSWSQSRGCVSNRSD